MSEDWKIRDAGVDDLETLVAFNCAMAEESEGRRLEPERVRAGMERMIREPNLGRCMVVVAADGGLAGAMMLTTEWSEWRNGLFWWIQSVYVAPKYRRTGVFSAVYRHVEREARATPDVCGLRLYVERENVGAQGTYLNLGMHETDYRLFEVDFSAE